MSHSVTFGIVFTLILVFQAKRVKECLDSNVLYSNLSIRRKTSDTKFDLELFLH